MLHTRPDQTRPDRLQRSPWPIEAPMASRRGSGPASARHGWGLPRFAVAVTAAGLMMCVLHGQYSLLKKKKKKEK